ncbi:MAG TPA: hypothetical protein VKV15_11160 [Bryobacteraceae bacterium]|nr:hypothetical protein [Bryobacteraceae bacterium]
MLGTFKRIGIVTAIAVVGGLLLQAAPQEKKQPQWKDRAEYDLEDSAAKDTNPTTRLQKLDQWKAKYPTTEFSMLRLELYLATYNQLNRPKEAFATAKELLAADPNNIRALSALVYSVFFLNPPSNDDLATAEKAAHQILDNLDTLFAADKKPAGMGEDAWQKNKKDVQILAQQRLGWIAWTEKNYPKAETEFLKALQLDPNASQVDYWLGGTLLAEKDFNKYSAAFFYFARAASYEGTGSLNAAGRQQVLQYLQKVYTDYHGSQDGLDQLLAQAKTTPTPPADFKVLSKVDIAKAKLQQEQQEEASHPMLTLWKNIKAALTAPDGDTYFNMNMKDALLPGGANGVNQFKGKLISETPAVHPKELILSIENGTTPDCKLKMDSPLPGKMEPGAVLSFSGVAKEYTKDPFMVTFEVEKSKLEGWEGKNAAPARPRRRPAAQ